MLGFLEATRRMRALAPEVLVPGHGPVCRGEEVGALLDEMEAYVAWITAVATESHAAGLTPLEAAQRHRGGPYADLAEGERVVCNLHRAYVELTDHESPGPLTIPALWPEMVALHGGPIVSHA